MTVAFGEKPVYVYGKIEKNRFISPDRTYKIQPIDLKTSYHPVKILEKPQIFYLAPIFNSYLTSFEEEVSRLYSLDGKITITKDKIEKDTLYTFKVVKETASVRTVEVFKYDFFYIGFKTKGKLSTKQKKGELITKVQTPYGKGPVLIQNNKQYKEDEEIDVIFYKKDKKMYFVQINDPLTEPIHLKVVKDLGKNCYLVAGQGLRGLLYSKETLKLREKVFCRPLEAQLGFYIFVKQVNLSPGIDIEAKIKMVKNDKILVTYEGYEGKVLISENSMFRKKGFVKGKIISVKENTFIMDLEKCKSSYDARNTKNSRISVPFDIEEKESSNSEEMDEIKNDKSLSAERKRAKIMNEEDFLMDIKAHPTEAMPVIKYMQYKIEMSETDTPKIIFDNYLARLEGEEKNNLCIAYTNYLLHKKDTSAFKTIKWLNKVCTNTYIEAIAFNTDDATVSKLYFDTVPCAKSYKRYLDALFKEDYDEALNLIDRNKEYLSHSIDYIYKYCEEPRVAVEKRLIDKKSVWLAYIKNESGSYLRALYRRIVDKDWKVNDMKEFYKMWLNYERECNGNIEEVKMRAKEYVESLKSK